MGIYLEMRRTLSCTVLSSLHSTPSHPRNASHEAAVALATDETIAMTLVPQEVPGGCWWRFWSWEIWAY